MKYSYLPFALALASATSVAAQTAEPATVPVPASLPAAPQTAMIVSTSTDNVLRVGTPIALKVSEGLTTEGKKLRAGARFNLETAEAITLNGMTVIPAGSPAVGEVTDVRNKGMWGKSGKINARILYVRVGDRQIRLSGQIDDKGVTGTAGVVGAVALLPVAGFFMTGTSARIPVGTPVKAFLDEDLTIAAPARTEITPVAPVPLTPAVAPATPVTTTPASVQKGVIIQ